MYTSQRPMTFYIGIGSACLLLYAYNEYKE